jgi:hypothetical protein
MKGRRVVSLYHRGHRIKNSWYSLSKEFAAPESQSSCVEGNEIQQTNGKEAV